MQPDTPIRDAGALRARFPLASSHGLQFRNVRESDLPFLAQLYASTRDDELAAVPWPDEAKLVFLAQQFQAQHRHYQTYYPEAERLIVLRDEAPVGRVYIARWPGEHRIVDIALLPEHRGRGLGHALMRDLLAEAFAAGKAVSIHVEKNNPALSLYRRLGFVAIEDKGVYDLMRSAAPQVNTAS